MWRYRLKVTLLVLGVVLGYGSALRHHGYGLGHGHCWNYGHAESCPWSMHDGARPDHAPSEKPGKPVQ
jgi:hypothetical protein